MKQFRRFLLAGLTLAVISTFLYITLSKAADGSGTNTVSPSSVTAGSAGNELTFTFTAAETMNSGEISITVPSGWTAPQAVAGSAGYTIATSSSGTIANVADAANSTSGWSAGSACTNGLTADTTTKFEGTAAIKCANGKEADNDVWYKNITTENWSSYTRVAFWLRSDKAISAGLLVFAYDDTANLASPLEELSVGAISANTWTNIVLTFGATSRTSVVSFGLKIKHPAALDNSNVWIDDILLGPGGVTFSGSDIRVRILNLAATQTVQVKYGSGGGSSGATAPSSAETSTFTTKTRVNSSGTLTNIATSPTVSLSTTSQILSEVTIPPDGRGGGVPPTRIFFAGKAYPGSKVKIFRRSLIDVRTRNTYVLDTEAVADAMGNFQKEFLALLQGEYFFAVEARDKDNRSSGIVAFTVDLISADKLVADKIFVPPTLDFSTPAITRGGDIRLFGYASPDHTVEAEVDTILKYSTRSKADGSWSISVNTRRFSAKDHFVRVRQVDDQGIASAFSPTKTFRVSLLAYPHADFNGDDIININDWSIFLSRWRSKDLEVRKGIDMDGNGKIDIGDFSIFLKAIRRS